MEIQDRNNVLQQLLGIKQFGSSAVSGLENGFVDILKSCGKKEASLSQPDFPETKRVAAETSKKQETTEKRTDAKDIKAKDSDKNSNVKKKSLEKKEAKADRIQVTENNQKANVVSEGNDLGEMIREEELVQTMGAASVETETQEFSDALTEIAVEGVSVDAELTLGLEEGIYADAAVLGKKNVGEIESSVSENKVENVLSDNFAAETEVAAVVKQNILPEEKIFVEASVSQGQAGAASLVASEILIADNKTENTMPELAGVWENKGAPLNDVVKENVKAEAAGVRAETDDMLANISEEDMLLMRQAKYIDDKTGGQKMKIDVFVQGENFAASAPKEVLQNRFEVDAVLRQMSDADVNVAEETDISRAESADMVSNVSPAADNKISGMVNRDQVAAVWQPSENATQIVSDASQVSLSGKEYAAEAVNGAKTEAFARINETSSRDVFKGMGKEAVEQIKINITKSAVKGVDTIDIQLKPEDLGKIQIKMHIAKDGKLQAEIISGRQETLDMLQKEVSGLVKAFEDAGYEADSRSFSFNFQDENRSDGQQNDEAGLLKFIGDTLEQEADNAAGNDNLIYDPALGLNIRV